MSHNIDYDILVRQLTDKYGWPKAKICEVYDTAADLLTELYRVRDPSGQYFPEPFPVHVMNDWNHLGITLVECGDNNMGQWVAVVKQPNVTLDDLDDPMVKG